MPNLPPAHGPDSDGSQESEPLRMTFNLSHVVVGHAYPATDVCAEIGRVTVAAARLDRALALLLVAVKYPEPLAVLLAWTSRELVTGLRKYLPTLFEPPLLDNALAVVTHAYDALQQRHSVAHTIWTLPGRAAAISVEDLSRAATPEELDALIRRDVPSDAWETLHPKARGPGPTLTGEIEAIRARIESAAEAVQQESFTVASAFFAGEPAGAKARPRPDDHEAGLMVHRRSA